MGDSQIPCFLVRALPSWTAKRPKLLQGLLLSYLPEIPKPFFPRAGLSRLCLYWIEVSARKTALYEHPYLQVCLGMVLAPSYIQDVFYIE